MGDTYTHGHQESVLRSHKWRTAENSAGYLLPRLTAGQSLLDVGCGPGTITLDLARLVAPGQVTGVDRSAEVIAEASALGAREGVTTARFAVADGYALDFPDDSFDVVHAHQVLQHLTDPVAALVEMRRVLRADGMLAVRDADYPAFAWFPADPLLDRWLEVYLAVTAHNGANADAGRRLLTWVLAAGFRSPVVTTGTWTFASVEDRQWWGDLWADRMQLSSLADQAVEYGCSDRAEMAAISEAWRTWSRQPDGFFAVLHGEVLAQR